MLSEMLRLIKILFESDIQMPIRTLALWALFAGVVIGILIVWAVVLRSRIKELRFSLSLFEGPYLLERTERPCMKFHQFQEFITTVRDAARGDLAVVLAATRALQVVHVKVGVVHTVLIDAQKRLARFEEQIENVHRELSVVQRDIASHADKTTLHCRERIEVARAIEKRLDDLRKGRDRVKLARDIWRQRDTSSIRNPLIGADL